MIKDLQVTLYDVFGYLLPGMVFLAALATLFWAIYLPSTEFVFDLPTVEIWIIFVVMSYVAGHMAQAVGNLITWVRPSTEELVLGSTSTHKGRLSESLVNACKAKAKEALSVDLTNENANWVYRFCDDAVIRSGKVGERDIYIYREGFYRGILIAMLTFAVATLALIVRLFWVEGHKLKTPKWDITQGQLVFFLLLWSVWAWLAFQRYRRFGEYRITHALLGFLTVKEEKKPDAKKDEPK